MLPTAKKPWMDISYFVGKELCKTHLSILSLHYFTGWSNVFAPCWSRSFRNIILMFWVPTPGYKFSNNLQIFRYLVHKDKIPGHTYAWKCVCVCVTANVIQGVFLYKRSLKKKVSIIYWKKKWQMFKWGCCLWTSFSKQTSVLACSLYSLCLSRFMIHLFLGSRYFISWWRFFIYTYPTVLIAAVFYDCDIFSLRHNRDLPGSQWPDKYCWIQCCASGIAQHLLLATLPLILSTWETGRSERLPWCLHIFKEGSSMCFAMCHFGLLGWPGG